MHYICALVCLCGGRVYMSRCYVVSVKFEVIIWFTLYDFESSSDGGGGGMRSWLQADNLGSASVCVSVCVGINRE